MEIWECIACPRCKALVGEECVQRDPDDPADGGQHSARIHAFIEEAPVEQRVAYHRQQTRLLVEVHGITIDLAEGSIFASAEEVGSHSLGESE